MKLEIHNRSGHRLPRQFLQAWLDDVVGLVAREERATRRTAREERATRRTALTLVFLNAREARRLNREYRGRDYATDVLSFHPVEPGSLGELVICPHVIARQAREHRLTFREELGYMVLHGYLHLRGYDHERSKAAARRMLALQDRVFDLLCRKRETARSKKTR